jgi:hypothetical protein
MAEKIMAVAVAIFTFLAEFMKGLVLLLPDLIKLIHLIVQWFIDRKQREIDAEQAQVTNQLKAQSEEQTRAMANLRAFQLLLEESWKVRYEQILTLIQVGDLAGVLILTESIDNAEVDAVLFHTEVTAELKAMRIIQIMRKEKPQSL